MKGLMLSLMLMDGGSMSKWDSLMLPALKLMESSRHDAKAD
jgi:hypothetical protein